MFIRPYVCNTKLEKLDHEFYLIFSVKLGDHKRRKVTQPEFSGKLSKSGRGSYNGQNGPKSRFFIFFEKLGH